ncbi:MAG: hypothetical protein V1743_03660 [Nanoarchaeota archaeon]
MNPESSLERVFRETCADLGTVLQEENTGPEYSSLFCKDTGITVSYQRYHEKESGCGCPCNHEKDTEFEIASFQGASKIVISGELTNNIAKSYQLQFHVPVSQRHAELQKIQYDPKRKNPHLHLSNLIGYMVSQDEHQRDENPDAYRVFKTELASLQGVKTFVLNQLRT